MASLAALSIFTLPGLADIDRGAEVRRPHDATTSGDSQTEYLVDVWNTEGLMQQTVRAVRQWAGGEEIKAVRPMTIGGIIGTVVGVLILLLLLVIPLLIYFAGGF